MNYKALKIATLVDSKNQMKDSQACALRIEIDRRYGSQCVILDVGNSIPTTEYRDISVENVTLNGKRICKEEMCVIVEEKTASALSVN